MAETLSPSAASEVLPGLTDDPRISEAQAAKMRRIAGRLTYAPDWYWTIAQSTTAGLFAVKGLRIDGAAFDESEVIDRLPPGTYRARLYAKGGGLVFTSDEFRVSETAPRTPGAGDDAAAAAPAPIQPPPDLAMREALAELRREVAEQRRGGVGLTLGDLSALIASLGTTAAALVPLFKREQIGIKDILPLINKSSITEAVEGLAMIQRLQGESGGGGGDAESAMLAAFAPLIGKLLDSKAQQPPPPPLRITQHKQQISTVTGPALAQPAAAQTRPQQAPPAPTPNPPAEQPPDFAALAALAPLAQAILFSASSNISPESIAPAIYDILTAGAEDAAQEQAQAEAIAAASAAQLADDWRRESPPLATLPPGYAQNVAAAVIEWANDTAADLSNAEAEPDDEEADEAGRPGIDTPGAIDDDGNPRAGNPHTAPRKR